MKISFIFQTIFFFLVFIHISCYDNFDFRLKYHNTTNDTLVSYWSTDFSDTNNIGEWEMRVFPNDFDSIPWPNNFEEWLNRNGGRVKISFFKQEDTYLHEQDFKKKAIKTIVIDKKTLDSINWILSIP